MTPGITVEYAKINSGVGTAEISKFAFLQTVYYFGVKAAECEYKLTLSGTFLNSMALEPALSGKTEVVKGNELCPGAENVWGSFSVTSNGTAVEAK